MKLVSVGVWTDNQVAQEKTVILTRLTDRRRTTLALLDKPTKPSAIVPVVTQVQADAQKLLANGKQLVAKKEKTSLDEQLFEDRKKIVAMLEALVPQAHALLLTVKKLAADSKSPVILTDGEIAKKYKKVVDDYFDVLDDIIDTTAKVMSKIAVKDSGAPSWLLPVVGGLAVASVAAVVVTSRK